jgi:pSer/pThr/pTyr-binding forkhead associated (FHA) protein
MVQLDAPGVSRRHALVSVTRTGAVIEDLESKNGTMVNDTTVTQPLGLHDGDRIRVGPIEVVYRAAADMSTDTVVRSAQDRDPA